MTKTIPYRLGIDLGTNSLGFALVALREGQPLYPIHLGVRIFDDGRDAKKGTSLAVDRRVARGMRCRRDRLLRRRQQLIELLVRRGLMPKDRMERKQLELLDPYFLRKKGLDEKLTPYELGRALFHLNQRRGFQSNRKQAKETEAGAINEASKKLQTLLSEKGFRTYGEFLYSSPAKRIRNASDEALKTSYAFYPLRDMLKAEYDALLTAQATYHPALLAPDVTAEIREVLFYQRALKPVQKGRCSLLPQEERAYAALPSSERFRILKEVNNLRIVDRLWRRNRDDLTDEQRGKIVAELYKKKTVSFDGLRKVLKLDSSTMFNLDWSRSIGKSLMVRSQALF
jgi:CRISPR-associated endonuclease Csn1